MKKHTNTQQRVAHILEQMQKAMPEIRRQIEVYEKNMLSGKQVKSKVTVQSRNV